MVLESSGGSNGVDDISEMKNKSDEKKAPRKSSGNDGKRTDYDVAKGLKQLYNSVLDEPLPPSFQDLLTKLDQGKK